MSAGGQLTDLERARLGAVRALRELREVDRRLAGFDLGPVLLKQFVAGMITREELLANADLPTVSDAHDVLRDALGLFPPLDAAEIEATERVRASGWVSVEARHRPTDVPVAAKARDGDTAHRIAHLMLARIVWAT
jgi:hypothetical protein